MNNPHRKTAVITGATSGIGMAISLRLIKEGVFCYLVGRNFDLIESKLKDDGSNCRFVRADISKDSGLKALEKQIDKDEINYLIHCAGLISLGEHEKSNVENLDAQYAVNLRAPFYITKMLLGKIKAKRGDIVFINSTAGLDAWETVGQYAATKHALRAMTDSLRKEVSKDKIRVTSLFLGSVDTPMQQNVQKQYGNENYEASKYMKPDDIAETVAFILKLPNEMAVTDMTIRQNT